jgi:integrase
MSRWKLTTLEVKHANKTGRYADGGGLYLQVSPNGSRSWILRYRLNGRRRHLGLGPLQRVALAEARVLASAAQQTLREGHDPIEARGNRRATAMVAAAKTMSFAACAGAYIDAHAAGWKPRNTKQWRASLAGHAFPVLGALPVAAIDTGLVMKVIEPLWLVKVETASRLRGRIEAVLDWAKVRGFRDGENPARWDGHLANLLASKSDIAKVVHLAAMPYDQLPGFMDALREYPGTAGRALQFLILTAARSGEVYGARWEEIDLGAKVWTVPAARMKMKREHRVPLSDAAVTLLGAMPGPRTGIVFQAPRAGGYPLAKMAMINVLKRMGHGDVTVHGFRSVFSTWAAERTAFPSETIEMSLAHVTGNAVQRAYNRSDRLGDRAKLMAQWADFCSGATATAEVIPLRA